jgi:hypothetical protein
MLQLEMERLRGAVDTGFATLNGRLDVALQRQSQTEADVGALEQKHEQDVKLLEDRHTADVTALRKHVDEQDQATRSTLSTVQRTVWMGLGGVLVIATIGGWLLETLVR